MDQPATEFVARFVGEVNVLEGVPDDGRVAIGGLGVPLEQATNGRPVRVVIRSYDLKFWRCPDGVATVDRVQLLGDRVKVEATIDGGTSIFAHFPRRSSLLKGIEPGSRISVEVTRARAYPAATPPAS
jgi:sulfate/thiosulfate transport system ATP-binding protein